jgi:hypothetical protein
MKRVLALVGLTAAVSLACAPVAAHAAESQSRTCPLPVVGGDPDVVRLDGPATTASHTWTVTADESPGEASHVVALTIIVTSNAGTHEVTAGTGFSPVHLAVDLAPGRHYTIQWVAAFDFGIHPCTSLLPGQNAFEIDT